MRNFYNKIKNMDKRYKKAACVLLLAIGVIVTGISLAYFTSRDETTNALAGRSYKMQVLLTEPEWNSSGYDKAQEIVPGMEIAKDPTVTNMLAENAYIRLKLEFVVDANDDGTDETYSLPVLESKMLQLFDYYYETDAAKEGKANGTSLINDNNKNDIYSRLLSAVYNNTTTTDETTGETTEKHSHLMEIANGAITGTTNSYFYYYDGWFYYLDSANTVNANKTDLKKMAYQEQTKAPLFTDIKLPVMKDEYNDLFANGFKINVVVQAVDADQFVDGDNNEYIPNVKTNKKDSSGSAMDDIVSVFNIQFPTGS